MVAFIIEVPSEMRSKESIFKLKYLPAQKPPDLDVKVHNPDIVNNYINLKRKSKIE